MKRKRKNSAQAMLESLRGRQADNNSTTSQDLQQQISGYQLDDQLDNENLTTHTFGNDNLNSSSSSNEANSKNKEEPLLVKIKDILTGEVTTEKMQADRVWNLEKNKKNCGGTQRGWTRM
ncbi:uncharacterized protein LOC132053605 [Lycium ferocissimum]|uniref:uncharacterized protein LOC132053605 n=1 Tax=Lycium ferocissimum TaxID=112874 RepID=UPI0028159F8C|nr:uncharacterized protein LOC132053605 [Lycium ferocissimum]